MYVRTGNPYQFLWIFIENATKCVEMNDNNDVVIEML